MMNLAGFKSAHRMIAVALSLLITTNCGTSQAPRAHSPPPAQTPAPKPGEPVTAPSKPTPTPIPGTVNYPASATKYYRLMLKDDPATSIVIGYSLPLGSTAATKVYYDTTDFGRDIQRYSDSSGPTSKNQFRGLNNYFVELKRLEPDTVYYFVVADEKGVSARYSFKTQPDNRNARLSVVAGGDSRSNRAPRQRANLLVGKLRPNFVMFAGDMTGSGTEAEWAEWFKDWQLTIANDGRMTPTLFTRGNHESNNEILEKLFYTPTGVYYAISFADDLLRVYTLNSEAAVAGTQTEWLKSDLAKHSHVTYKFAQYHRPMRPTTSGKSDFSSGYSLWAPLFYSSRMTLVSEADAHTVKATWPIRPSTSGGSQEGFVRDDAEGTVYVGEGCWGAPLRANDDNRSWTRASGRFNSFNWITVDKNQVEVRTIKVDNASSVGQNSDSNRFTAPANLDVWAPASGAVITIKPRSQSGLASAANG